MKTQELLADWSGTTVLSFRKVDEPLGWLSNMSPHPIRVDTIRYPTCEHFFQCMRFEDEGIR
ncbi:MAG: NADAR family protein, partial [bacterium]